MQLHEIDGARGRPPPAVFGVGVRLDRFELAQGIDVCICEYRATSGARPHALANRLEIGVQLAGRLMQRGHRSGPGVHQAGDLFVLSPGEAYDTAYQAGDPVSVAVWLSVDVDALVGDGDRELIVVAGGRRDAELGELAHLLYTGSVPRERLSTEAARAVRAYLARACDLSPRDRVVAARRILDRTFDCDLYLKHVAHDVGLRPTALLRRFARRYGVTPIQYRLQTRLNRANRLGWACRNLSAAEIAEACGFSSAPYFHRQYKRYFGVTPAAHRRNSSYLRGRPARGCPVSRTETARREARDATNDEGAGPTARDRDGTPRPQRRRREGNRDSP